MPGTFVKNAMNAGIEVITKLLAKELAPIRGNVVSPALTATEAYAGMAEEARQAMLDRAAANVPAGRFGRPEDLAQGYLFASRVDIDGGALIN